MRNICSIRQISIANDNAYKTDIELKFHPRDPLNGPGPALKRKILFWIE